MHISRLPLRLWAVPALAGLLAFFVLAIQHAAAFDPAAGYRNRPGFRCLSQNARGECFDFVYGGSSRGTSTIFSTEVEGDVSIDIGTPNIDHLVRRGSTAEFRIVLTNETSRRVTTDVRASLDAGMSFVSGTSSPRRITNRTVEWRDVRVEEDDDKQLILRVRIANNLTIGDELTLTIETDDGATQEVTLEVTNSSVATYTCDSTYYYVDGRRVTGRRGRSTSCDDFDDDDEDGEYTIRISDTPDPFEPGELVTYTIVIRNEDETSRRVDVHAFLDDNVDYVSASEVPDEIESDEVVWEDVSIGRDGTRTYTLSLRTDRGLDDGDLVNLRVEVGDNAEEEDTEAFFP
jgi:hypothetical protein